jgi:hypothetical protein
MIEIGRNCKILELPSYLMSGLIFFKTEMLETIEQFYKNRIGMDEWLRQADCIILKHDNLLLGFCQRDESDTQGIITFYFDSNEEVDGFYDVFENEAEDTPRYNEKYQIYHFFIKDPEGRRVEFQSFKQMVKNPC